MSRLYNAIRKLAGKGDHAAIGVVSGMAGPGRYWVMVNGQQYDVPALGGASAMDGESVAVLISAATNQPIAMLGVVKT